MKYKLITVLYLCICTSLIVRSDEEEEVEESGSGEEESAEEVKFSYFIFFLLTSKIIPLAHCNGYSRLPEGTRLLARGDNTHTDTQGAISRTRTPTHFSCSALTG